MRIGRHSTQGWRAGLGTIRLGLALVLLLVLPGGAQGGQQTQHGAGSIGQQVGPYTVDGPDNDPVEQEKRLKALNAERQKSMVADTNRLVKLATELDAELNGERRESLNSDQLRKFAEIEKLAKNIREKMSLSVKGIPLTEPMRLSPK
jgi:hypothetical protein